MKLKTTIIVNAVLLLLSSVANAQPSDNADKAAPNPAAKHSNSKDVELNSINVQSNENNRDIAINDAGATSSRGETTNMQSIDEIFRGIPGTFTQIDKSQGSVTVNIRGVAGMGRVDTKVDGVTQNFFGTAASAHHGSVGQSQFGALVDSNFMVGVDVNRGFTREGGNANALMGSANIKLLDVKDIISDKNKFGSRIKFNTGTNGLGTNGMLAAAAQTNLGEEGNIATMLALSGGKISGSFKNGNGQNTNDFFDASNPQQYFSQQPRSSLFRVNVKANDQHSIKLSHRYYKNNVGRRSIYSSNLYANYHYTPFSELINLQVSAAAINERQKYVEDTIGTLNSTAMSNTSKQFEANNTSVFKLGQEVDARVVLGFTYNKTKFDSSKQSSVPNPIDAQDNLIHTPFGIRGDSIVANGYLNSEFLYDKYTLKLGLGSNYYKVKGYIPYAQYNYRWEITEPGYLNNSYHTKNVNQHWVGNLLLEANVTNNFVPFVNFSRTTRAANIQEMFFNNESALSMNPFLKPEIADTAQLGFSYARHSLFAANDRLNLKMVIYQSWIKNYIDSSLQTICGDLITRQGRLCSQTEADELVKKDKQRYDYQAASYKSNNLPDKVKIRGLEIEATYLWRNFYAFLSYTLTKNEQPVPITARKGFSFQDISQTPSWFGSLDLGANLMHNKIQLGTLIKATGNAQSISRIEEFDDKQDTLKKETIKIPVTFDVYMSYQFKPNMFLRLSVQNLFNRNYTEALNKANYLAKENEHNARGRTFLLGLDMKF